MAARPFDARGTVERLFAAGEARGVPRSAMMARIEQAQKSGTMGRLLQEMLGTDGADVVCPPVASKELLVNSFREFVARKDVERMRMWCKMATNGVIRLSARDIPRDVVYAAMSVFHEQPDIVVILFVWLDTLTGNNTFDAYSSQVRNVSALTLSTLTRALLNYEAVADDWRATYWMAGWLVLRLACNFAQEAQWETGIPVPTHALESSAREETGRVDLWVPLAMRFVREIVLRHFRDMPALMKPRFLGSSAFVRDGALAASLAPSEFVADVWVSCSGTLDGMTAFLYLVRRLEGGRWRPTDAQVGVVLAQLPAWVSSTFYTVSTYEVATSTLPVALRMVQILTDADERLANCLVDLNVRGAVTQVRERIRAMMASMHALDSLCASFVDSGVAVSSATTSSSSDGTVV